MPEVHLAHTIDFLVGIVHILHLVYEPCIAVGIRILHRNGLSALQRHDEVFGIQHVQYRIDTVAVHLGHIAARSSYRLHRLLHLRSDMCINHLLVATELGWMITADALVVVRGLVLIECIRCQIQHTVVECLVTADNLVGLGHLLRCIALRLVYEHIIVEIALVHHPHIHQTEHGDTGNHIFLAQLLHLEEHQQYRTDEDNPERTPAVGCEDALADIRQIAHDWRDILLRQLLQRLCLLYRYEIREEYARHDGEEQTETCCQTEAGIYIFYLLCQNLRLIHNLLQRHHRQQRNGKLGYHEDRCHRSELSIHRHIIEEEIGKRHEVSTPSEQDAQDGGSKQRPLHRTLHDKQTQNKEHADEGTYIYRSARSRLVAPVLSQLLVNLNKVRISLLHSLLVLRQRNRSTALGIRNHQRPGFVDTVTPLCDIVSIQTAAGLVSRIFLYEFALSSHGFLTVLPGMIKVREVERDTDEGTHHAYRRSLSEACEFTFLDGIYQEGNHHEEDDKEVVISHLHVVCLHLESREDGSKEQSLEILAPIGKHHARNHRRQISQRPYLPDMSGSNDDEKVGRECPDDTSQRRQRLSEVEGTQHDIEAQEVYENIPYIVWQPQMICLHNLAEHLITVIRRRHLIGRHTAKHRVRPSCSLSRLLLEEFLFMSQSLSCRCIMSEEDSSVHIGRHKVDKGDDCKCNNYQNIQ